ncbi:kinase-like domain-containing protein [Phycomyces nitens]|nr:kinase-like domain-containing protein [Phycomyces nitens]
MTAHRYAPKASFENISAQPQQLDHSLRAMSARNSSIDSNISDLSQDSLNVIIDQRWIPLGKIGEGSFGEVFEVEEISTKKHFAIKRERANMRHPQLENEAKVYKLLEGGPGIPRCYWYGRHEDFNCIVMDLLGPSLNQLRKTVHKIPLDVVIDLASQMVSILEHVHQKGLVFRDVKPDNFLFSAANALPEPEMYEVRDTAGGPGHYEYTTLTCRDVLKKWGESYPRLFIVDFGLAVDWANPDLKVSHSDKKRDQRNKVGTARYASINVHRGKVHSRRDDLEGIGYMVLELLLGTLPWTGIQARSSKNGWDKMRQMKEDTFMSDLCAGMPTGILEFVEYTRKLRPNDEPDYNLLRQMLFGCVGNGRLSQPVRSPFGGPNGKKIWKDVEDGSRAQLSKYNQNAQTGFSMESVSKALPDTGASPMWKGVRPGGIQDASTSSTSSAHRMISKTTKGEKRIGWNTHKHDEVPWEPKVDWNTNASPAVNTTTRPVWDTKPTKVAWGGPEPTWSQPEDDSWAKKNGVPW